MYGLLTAILVVFVELEVAALAAWWPLLEIWLGRAMLQSFVGVLTYRCGGEAEDRLVLACMCMTGGRGVVVKVQNMQPVESQSGQGPPNSICKPLLGPASHPPSPLCMCREALPRGDTDFHRSLALYRGIASVALLVCSGVYAVGWISCLGTIKHSE